MLKSNILRRTLYSTAIVTGLFLAYTAGRGHAASQVDLVEAAADKLTIEEVGALTAPFLAVAEASQDSCRERGDGPSLADIIRFHRELMEELLKPAKFIGPYGEEYDSYADYLRGVYGVRLGC